MIEGQIRQATDIRARTRVAVLVDGENIAQKQADLILEHAGIHGNVIVRRVYGDMRLLDGWEADHRFDSIHTGHGRSKNTADMNLVIDAMDLAHDGNVTAFVIVSSDGDFAPLATRLREAGHTVAGLGGKAASQCFRDACTDFHAIMTLEAPVTAPSAPIPAVRSAPVSETLSMIDLAIHRVCRKHGGTQRKITLVELGRILPSEERVQRTETGRSTWRAYLMERGNLYTLEGKAPETTVRLKTT